MPAAALIDRFRSDLEALSGAPAPRLGLAVSGGPDSVALLLLCAAAYPGGVEAASVDHGLRPEAADEAALAGRHCTDLGVCHETLVAPVTAAGQGVPSAARAARYAALADWMNRRGLAALLTAHHLDDQAETLLMRLQRGSGVGGLAGIRARGPVPGCEGSAVLYRPLLGWRRAELAEVLAASGLDAADDPTNRDERFDRARLRRHLAESPWLDPVPLARSAAFLAEAEDALEQTAAELFISRVDEAGGTIAFTPDNVTRELKRRVVLRCLRTLAPGAKPRGEQLAELVAGLERGETRTLGGVKCDGGDQWRFEAAAARRRSSS